MKLVLLTIIAALATPALAQTSRVNLEDVKIDGELQKEGLSLASRQRFTIESEIEVRETFKDHLLEYLPPGYRRPAQDKGAK